MKNTLILLAVLLVAGGFYFLFVYNSGGTSQNQSETSFAVKDTNSITRIVLTKIIRDQPGNKIILEKQLDGNWSINGKYTAKSNRVSNLLKTIGRLEVKDPLNAAGREVALGRIKKNHTEVQVYGLQGIIKHYYIGAANKEHTGNIMLMKGAENPVVMFSPGHTGYVSIYYTTLLNNWRENLLFNASADQLQRVDIHYGTDPTPMHLFREAPNAPWMIDENQLADSAKTAEYLSFFRGKVFAEGFVDSDFPEMLDSLKKTTPSVTFSTINFDGSQSTVYLHLRPGNDDNYFGWVDGNEDLLTVQHYIFDKYLRPVDYFLPPSL